MTELLSDVATGELRARRDRVRDEEQRLSYRRRLLHAQLDIVAAAADSTTLDDLTTALGRVLADAPSGADGGPPRGETRAVEVEAIELAELTALPEDLLHMDAAARRELLEQLRDEEQAVSSRRRALLDELDTIQDELVRRYRTDGVDVSALLAGGGDQ